jgi:hypothetical protein
MERTRLIEKMRFGHEMYLNDDCKRVMPVVEELIQTEIDKGKKVIYFKSHNLEPEVSEKVEWFSKLPSQDKKQIITMCLRERGFKSNGRYTHRPVLSLVVP